MLSMSLFLLLELISSSPTAIEFQSGDVEDEINYTGRYQVADDLRDATVKDSTRYLTSSLYFKGVSFKGCMALGSGLSLGSGGAIYVQSSQLYMENSDISHSIAVVGGGLSSVNSFVHLNEVTFQFTRALQMAGGMFVVFADIEDSEDYIQKREKGQCYIDTVTFEGCRCNEFHGAATFSNVDDLFITDSTFNNCSAGHSAGAVAISDSPAVIYNTQFIDCSVKKEIFVTLQQVSNSNVNMPKGGGALLFSVTNLDKENGDGLLDLVTYMCSFCGNSVFNDAVTDTLDGNITGFGHDILFHGISFWRSYTDSFTRSRLQALGYLERTRNDTLKNSFKFHVFLAQNSTHSTFENEEISCAIATSNNTLPPSLAVITVGQETDFGHTNVPDPTKLFEQTPFATGLQGPTSTGTRSQSYTTYFEYPATPSKIQTATPSLTRSPTRSSYLELPLSTPNTPTQSDRGETPAAPTMSFHWEVPATPKPSQTHVDATWPLQSTTANTPLATSYGETIVTSIPTQSSLWEIPDPTASPSISFQFEPSPSQTPSQSPTRSPASTLVNPSRSLTVTKKTVLTPGYITIVSEVPSVFSGFTEFTDEFGRPTVTETITLIPILETVTSLTQIYVTSEVEEVVFIEGVDTTEPEPSNVGMIVGIVIGALVLVVAGGILIWFFYPKHDESSGTSQDGGEMAAETVVQLADTTSTKMTQDNPLWTSGAMEDTDDPFRDDFEEDENQRIKT